MRYEYKGVYNTNQIKKKLNIFTLSLTLVLKEMYTRKALVFTPEVTRPQNI